MAYAGVAVKFVNILTPIIFLIGLLVVYSFMGFLPCFMRINRYLAQHRATRENNHADLRCWVHHLGRKDIYAQGWIRNARVYGVFFIIYIIIFKKLHVCLTIGIETTFVDMRKFIIHSVYVFDTCGIDFIFDFANIGSMVQYVVMPFFMVHI